MTGNIQGSTNKGSLQGNKYRAIFISDVHLGTSACQAEYLIDFLTENTADKIYLVGDIVDFIAMRKRVYFSPQHEEVLALILKKARSGTQVIYIPGNHDAIMRRFCGQTISGVDIRFSAVHETMNGESFYVSHGDEFDGIMQCSAWLNWLGDVSHGFLLRLNTFVNLVRKSWKLPYWSLARAVKKRIGKAQDFINQFERISARDAYERNYDGYICGHIHHWQMTYHESSLYINDGDWVEHCTALVETMQGDLAIVHWADEKEVLVRRSELAKPEIEESEEWVSV
ncbi:MAG: UDP-2,3-diacylglucosamine diphosphatase [Pseudomonadales bacterium]|nr:UDP-2,3-diacylglucosamine diphosphatase [Pseudomonadales bacterium]